MEDRSILIGIFEKYLPDLDLDKGIDIRSLTDNLFDIHKVLTFRNKKVSRGFRYNSVHRASIIMLLQQNNILDGKELTEIGKSFIGDIESKTKFGYDSDIKLTKEDLSRALNSHVRNIPLLVLEEVFTLLGFRIKEVSGLGFEIHYKNTYIVHYSGHLSNNMASYTNENISFSDGCDGISSATKNLKQLIQNVLGLFMYRMYIDYEGCEWDEDRYYMYTIEEYTELVGFIGESLQERVASK